MKKNLEFLSKALSLLPEVKETLVPPKEGQFFSKPLGKGDWETFGRTSSSKNGLCQFTSRCSGLD